MITHQSDGTWGSITLLLAICVLSHMNTKIMYGIRYIFLVFPRLLKMFISEIQVELMEEEEGAQSLHTNFKTCQSILNE